MYSKKKLNRLHFGPATKKIKKKEKSHLFSLIEYHRVYKFVETVINKNIKL